jgi:putative transposase
MMDMGKEQIYRGSGHWFIKRAEADLSITDLCRKSGFSDVTFYKWRAKDGSMDLPDA